MRFQRIVFYVLLIVLMLLVGGGLAAQEEKILVIGWNEPTDSYDPARGYTEAIVRHADYDTLVTFPDEDASSIIPSLASSWTVSDDGLVYTFTLSDKPRFNNGDPVTADDVVFSFKRLQNVKSNPSFLAAPDRIAAVTAVDDKTVTITLPAPRSSFLVEIASPIFTISNADEIRANGGTDADDAATTDTAEEYLNQHSAGTGPYMLESWAKQDKTVLVRNPNYWDTAPYFDRVILVNIPEASAQKAALESGQIDIAVDLQPDQIAELKDNPDISIFSGPSLITHFLIMNADPEISGPLADPKVELAVRYGLDYAGYRELWPGSYTPGTNLAYGIAGAFQQDKAFVRDVDKAKELMAEAGYADGIDVTLDYPDATAGGINYNTNAQKIQSDLADIGIRVTLNPMEQQVALERYRSGDMPFGLFLWGPDVLDPVDLIPFLPGGSVAGVRARWTSDKVDPSIVAMIEQAKVEPDPDKRMELFQQLQEWAQQNSVFAPFLTPPISRAYRSNLQGYILHPAWDTDVALLSRAE